MSDRTDLFKALNNFMATIAAYAPGSHREDVVLEVGDTAFRAFERALQPRLPELGTSATGVYDLQCHTQSGRVVIRKRQPSLADLAAAEDKAMDDLKACSTRSGMCMAVEYQRGTCVFMLGHEGRHSYEVSETAAQFALAEEAEARAQREAQLEREKAAQLEQPIRHVAPPMPQEVRDYIEAVAALDAKQTGINSVVRGHPPEETKPPARAHLKGCVLDTDHPGGCDGSSIKARQALGEALACVERLKTLMAIADLDDYGFCHEDGMTLGGAVQHVSGVIRGVRHRVSLESEPKT